MSLDDRERLTLISPQGTASGSRPFPIARDRFFSELVSNVPDVREALTLIIAALASRPLVYSTNSHLGEAIAASDNNRLAFLCELGVGSCETITVDAVQEFLAYSPAYLISGITPDESKKTFLCNPGHMQVCVPLENETVIVDMTNHVAQNRRFDAQRISADVWAKLQTDLETADQRKTTESARLIRQACVVDEPLDEPPLHQCKDDIKDKLGALVEALSAFSFYQKQVNSVIVSSKTDLQKFGELTKLIGEMFENGMYQVGNLLVSRSREPLSQPHLVALEACFAIHQKDSDVSLYPLQLWGAATFSLTDGRVPDCRHTRPLFEPAYTAGLNDQELLILVSALLQNGKKGIDAPIQLTPTFLQDLCAVTRTSYNALSRISMQKNRESLDLISAYQDTTIFVYYLSLVLASSASLPSLDDNFVKELTMYRQSFKDLIEAFRADFDYTTRWLNTCIKLDTEEQRYLLYEKLVLFRKAEDSILGLQVLREDEIRSITATLSELYRRDGLIVSSLLHVTLSAVQTACKSLSSFCTYIEELLSNTTSEYYRLPKSAELDIMCLFCSTPRSPLLLNSIAATIFGLGCLSDKGSWWNIFCSSIESISFKDEFVLVKLNKDVAAPIQSAVVTFDVIPELVTPLLLAFSGELGERGSALAALHEEIAQGMHPLTTGLLSLKISNPTAYDRFSDKCRSSVESSPWLLSRLSTRLIETIDPNKEKRDLAQLAFNRAIMERLGEHDYWNLPESEFKASLFEMAEKTVAYGVDLMVPGKHEFEPPDEKRELYGEVFGETIFKRFLATLSNSHIQALACHFRLERGFGGDVARISLDDVHTPSVLETDCETNFINYILSDQLRTGFPGMRLSIEAVREGTREIVIFGSNLDRIIRQSGLTPEQFLLRGHGVPVPSMAGDVREWVPYTSGNFSLKDIDWKVSARAGQLIARRRTEFESRHIHFKVDAEWIAGSDWDSFSHNIARFLGSVIVMKESGHSVSLSVELGNKSLFKIDATELNREIKSKGKTAVWSSLVETIWITSIKLTQAMNKPWWSSVQKSYENESKIDWQVKKNSIFVVMCKKSVRTAKITALWQNVQHGRCKVISLS